MLHGWRVVRPSVFSLLVLLSSTPASGSFEIAAHSVRADQNKRETTFAITFTQPPDFFHADEEGRAANAFQYFYNTEPVSDEFAGEHVTIIRGAEIRFGSTIPVRESLNDSGEEFPHAEGWGPSRGQVPFDLKGTNLSFTVPWNLLGETDGRFAYRLLAFENGSETSEVGVVTVPLPRAVWAGGAGLGALGIARAWRRKSVLI